MVETDEYLKEDKKYELFAGKGFEAWKGIFL